MPIEKMLKIIQIKVTTKISVFYPVGYKSKLRRKS